MIVEFHKDFKKELNKLSRKYQEQFLNKFELFNDNPFHPLLNNHQLHGTLKNRRSINITGDIRAVYEQVSKDKFIFLTIGNHNNLYN